ncbi:hypothetical protein [Marivita hallyeonensis]|uniref:Uncharacterized protein n=1 Tax=Marivita hallyeonensis TaxID=996342 RepID=A0A1M5XS06_9RHOB|nr:hypothetical protein [Marivita hallyeonensis]SHI02324.1 hypothetical protein SAMN05443551_4078 [Marivita hallyeonensis]
MTMPRTVYVLIPLGFVALAGGMVLVGERTGGPAAPPSAQIETSPLDTGVAPQTALEVVDDPDTDGSFIPSPSGPEYGDNETVLEEIQN